MRITESQALNIVRTYNKQLRVGSMEKTGASNHSDTVALSEEARRLGGGTTPEPAAEKSAPSALPSVETRIKSHTDLVVQRNLPFE